MTRVPAFILAATAVLAGCVRQAEPGAGTTSAPTSQRSGTTSRPTGGAPPAAAAKSGAPRLDEAVYDHFGAGVTVGAAPLGLAAVAAAPAEHDGKRVRLEGVVGAVCKAKGCWMELVDGSHRVRVTFKDYGFFVPKDIEGRAAVLEGTFEVKTVSAAEARHFLEDAGKGAEAAEVTGPQKELRVVADGVALRKS